MASPSKQLQPRRIVALSRGQVEQIAYDMGLESEDAAAFWELACREAIDPGCLERENRQYLQRALNLTDGGQQ